ncbi:CPBP family intramembrane glutamic endopeptidase [Nocardioides sp. URHA0020]|uniref:CPBP family intramembrane glutamic endopeptidase n=1 Tax=Nocardioides sp. URHA0020 TaxID=1380392 RepID=UPI0006852CC0|nr:CPBP family intramembrane glutamic endopeptidase [Nocardioides sp. URHA0020]
MDALLAAVVVVTLCVATAAAVRARRLGHPLGAGIRGVGAARSIATGLAIAAAGMLVTTGLMAVAGVAHVDGVELHVGVLLLGALVFTLSAYVEELLFRVLMLGGLVRLTGRPWLALAVMAAMVGAFHLATTAHTTALSVLSSTLGGVMYGVAFLRTGSLWLGVGVHLGWNWWQGTVLGFTVSGTDDYSGALLQVHPAGADWLGGGDYGPEGSVLSLVGRLVIIGLVLAVTAGPGRPSPGTSSSCSPAARGR